MVVQLEGSGSCECLIAIYPISKGFFAALTPYYNILVITNLKGEPRYDTYLSIGCHLSRGVIITTLRQLTTCLVPSSNKLQAVLTSRID